MRRNAPPEKRARLHEVAFASPGYLRFKVDPEIAAAVRSAVSTCVDYSGIIRFEAASLGKWSNGHEDISDAEAKKILYCSVQKVSIDGHKLIQHTDTLEKAAQVLVSYIKRIEFLAESDKSESVMLIGLLGEEEKLV